MVDIDLDALAAALGAVLTTLLIVAIVATMISLAENCRHARKRSKAEAAARMQMAAYAERIERHAAIRRAYNLDKLPPSGKRPANPGPGLSPHPLRVSNLAHVIQPASDLPNMQSIGDHVGWGWGCAKANDTPATLCMPVDIDSTPESAGQP